MATQLFSTQPDPLVKDWFLINNESPAYIITILFIYFLLSFGILPYIKSTDFELKNVKTLMNLHNIILAVANIILGALYLFNMVSARYNIFCEAMKSESTDMEVELNLATLTWLYFLSKIFELNDIIFSIFRTKPNQAQINAQVYHHSSMVCLSWAGARYLPGGSTAIMSCINCCLHVIMYAYFTFSGKNFDCGGVLAARTFMFAATTIQFALVIIHCITGISLQCNYPTSAFILVLVSVFTYILGFSFGGYFSNCTVGVGLENNEVKFSNHNKTDHFTFENENSVKNEQDTDDEGTQEDIKSAEITNKPGSSKKQKRT